MKYTITLHIFFHYTRIWKKISVGGLYTSLFCAIIPALFPYFLPFWYPYILLRFQMFFITCIVLNSPHISPFSYGLWELRQHLQSLVGKELIPLYRGVHIKRPPRIKRPPPSSRESYCTGSKSSVASKSPPITKVLSSIS